MNIKKFYSNLLYLYPESYRKNYGKEMERVFLEMYREEKEKGSAGLIFWSKIIFDIAVSGAGQHLENLGEKGIRGYAKDTLYINGFNLLGFIFLLPMIFMLSVEIVSRIAQGDLIHYNRAAYRLFSHTFLYQYPVLVTWILILPTLALLLNFLSIILSISKRKVGILSLEFVKRNFFSLIFVGLGMFSLLLVFGHDIVPCTIHGISYRGIQNTLTIFNYCRIHA